MTPMKRHGGPKGLPQRSLATFKSTGVSFLVAVNHQEERAVAVLACLVEKVSCVLVIWELRRPHPCDGRVVETNKLLAYLYASNTNVQFLGGEDVVIAVAK